MRYRTILLAGIAATSAMTLCSYLLTRKSNRDYREPELLGDMEESMLPAPLQQYQSSFGWLSHYSIGIGFVAIYEQWFRKYDRQPKLLSGLLFGALAGVVGAASWRLMYEANDNPPNINHKKFYGQLVFVHLIFGVVAVSICRRQDSSHIVSLINKVKHQRQQADLL